jgi:hypothetical protein
MKRHVRSVENRTWTWRNCSFTDGDKEARQACLVHVDVCLLACLEVCVVFFVSLDSIAVCFYSSNVYTWGSQTYKLMSRVPAPLLAPCYFNETDSGTDKICILFIFFFFFLRIFLFRTPYSFRLSICQFLHRPIPQHLPSRFVRLYSRT